MTGTDGSPLLKFSQCPLPSTERMTPKSVPMYSVRGVVSASIRIVLTTMSGRSPERSVHVPPALDVRKTWPVPAPLELSPEYATYATPASAGSTAICVTYRAGSGPTLGPAILVQLLPRDVLSQTSPLVAPA